MKVSGLAAIVTGGASGLGGATAERLAALGAKVTVFDLNAELAAATARKFGGRHAVVDVTDEEAVERALVDAEAAHGRARILVNCAGIGPPAKVIDRDGRSLSLAAFGKIVNINLLGTFNVLAKFAARIVAADLVGEERGVIINTASVAAYDGQIGQAAYSASKGGIVAMTLPIARELAQFGIRVLAIAPGLFLTPLLAGLPQEAQDSLAASIPFPHRLGDPSEFASLVMQMIDNPYLNGEVVRLDASLRMAPK